MSSARAPRRLKGGVSRSSLRCASSMIVEARLRPLAALASLAWLVWLGACANDTPRRPPPGPRVLLLPARLGMTAILLLIRSPIETG